MNQQADFEQDLTLLLKTALHQATFLVPGSFSSGEPERQWSGSELRRLFHANSGYVRMQLSGHRHKCQPSYSMNWLLRSAST